MILIFDISWVFYRGGYFFSKNFSYAHIAILHGIAMDVLMLAWLIPYFAHIAILHGAAMVMLAYSVFGESELINLSNFVKGQYVNMG